jgi:hypothetical protein
MEKNGPNIGKGAQNWGCGRTNNICDIKKYTTRGLVPFMIRHEFSLPDSF